MLAIQSARTASHRRRSFLVPCVEEVLEISVIFVRNDVSSTLVTFARVCLDNATAERLGLHLVDGANDTDRCLHLRFRVDVSHRI